ACAGWACGATTQRRPGRRSDEAGDRRSDRRDPDLPVADLADPAARLPLRAELLGIRRRGDRAPRHRARRLAGAAPPAALPPLGRRRLRSGAAPAPPPFLIPTYFGCAPAARS